MEDIIPADAVNIQPNPHSEIYEFVLVECRKDNQDSNSDLSYSIDIVIEDIYPHSGFFS